MIDVRIFQTLIVLGVLIYLSSLMFVSKDKVFWTILCIGCGLIFGSGAVWVLQMIWS